MIQVGSKVRCVKGYNRTLMEGKIYTVAKILVNFSDKAVEWFGQTTWTMVKYREIFVGTGSDDGWGEDRFVEVGCPCAIKTCLTHRVAK